MRHRDIDEDVASDLKWRRWFGSSLISGAEVSWLPFHAALWGGGQLESAARGPPFSAHRFRCHPMLLMPCFVLVQVSVGAEVSAT